MKGDEFGFASLINNVKGTTKMKHKERVNELLRLRYNIIEWAREKGILDKATPEAQYLKVIEENGELARAILKKDSEEFKDALGDSFVTIVIHAELCFENYDMKNLPDWKDLNTEHVKNSGAIIEVLKRTGDKWHLGAIDMLQVILKNNLELAYNLDLCDCVQIAYDVISKRTGSMVNGSFIKD